MSNPQPAGGDDIAIRRRLLSHMITMAHLIPLSLAMGIAFSFYRGNPWGVVASCGLSLFLGLRIRRLWDCWRALKAGTFAADNN